MKAIVGKLVRSEELVKDRFGGSISAWEISVVHESSSLPKVAIDVAADFQPGLPRLQNIASL